MKNLITRLSIPFVLLAANSFGHTMAYPHGHPHALTTTWADVLITGGVIAIMAFGAAALFRWKDQTSPFRQRVR